MATGDGQALCTDYSSRGMQSFLVKQETPVYQCIKINMKNTQQSPFFSPTFSYLQCATCAMRLESYPCKSDSPMQHIFLSLYGNTRESRYSCNCGDQVVAWGLRESWSLYLTCYFFLTAFGSPASVSPHLEVARIMCMGMVL